MYYANWFKTEKEALNFQKKHGGRLLKNVKGSHSKKEFKMVADIFNIDTDVFKYIIERKLK